MFINTGHTGPVRAMTLTGPAVSCKLVLSGALHDNKICYICLVWAGAKRYKFSFLLCAGPLIILKAYLMFVLKQTD